MTTLTHVDRMLDLTTARKLETDEAERRTNAHITQLSRALSSLLDDDDVARVVHFLDDTQKKIEFGYVRDQNDKGWILLLSGDGFQKWEHPDTIRWLNKSGELEHAPRTIDVNPLQFAALWIGRYGVRENALDDIKNIVITQGENLAKQMVDNIEKANRPDRTSLYMFFVLGGFIGFMALADFLVNH